MDVQPQKQEYLPRIPENYVNHLPNTKKFPLDENFSLDCNINIGFLKGININNISDNENTALLINSHFPEYTHS